VCYFSPAAAVAFVMLAPAAAVAFVMLAPAAAVAFVMLAACAFASWAGYTATVTKAVNIIAADMMNDICLFIHKLVLSIEISVPHLQRVPRIWFLSTLVLNFNFLGVETLQYLFDICAVSISANHVNILQRRVTHRPEHISNVLSVSYSSSWYYKYMHLYAIMCKMVARRHSIRPANIISYNYLIILFITGLA
jgi:hypothetical protein